ncbi:OVARIAN TUMOR DOMAIN-containing deubiquitinating enzyme 12-like isoform X1 [Lycium barbarum]|uniref:OVARIAN TUMOR DOMAIN-containing deubiquitinating enzyme 12-like isoform X1 n=1 Tax=Lycium barbarum TaxID=112863 RepID=UPI00293E4C60|nr:OVARIAN TUMOR DOMAIN-containing deubiquitinating enzyme 12-like isoform X1 [Lycium barbarum]XP_060201509.1 OVARIAN TUMOR DOMAIN-containing deubiquitinating enzyme 12-like isoform X1 [Lycium barbarum]
MCEPESDAARGAFSFLDVDQLFSSNYYGDSRQHDIEISHEQYARENRCHPSYCNVENDELIAQALQEELSELSIAEDAESSHADQQYLQASTGVQHWQGPPREYYAGHDTGLEADDLGPSSSCSSPGNRSYDGEDYTYTLDIQDEFEIDGEVRKRINQLSAVPHVPRINGDIPSVDEATSDHQRLLDRLQTNDLVEHKVQGDGNCQFRALSDQFYRTPEHHKFVRQQIVTQLKAHPEIYEGYVPMAYDEYLKRMSENGEWGDHVTLQAAADSYGVKVFVLTSFKDTYYIEILPKDQKSNRVIYLSFWAEVHYNSIYPQGDFLPCDDFKKKKKKWSFWNMH